MLLNILLTLIFVRPFISSTFTQANTIYTLLLLGLLFLWLKKIGLKKIGTVPTQSIFNHRDCPYFLPLFFFLLALFISIIFSANKLNSLKIFPNYITAVLAFLAAASLSTDQRNKVLRTIRLCAFVISLIAIYQYLFGFQHVATYITKKGITDPFVLDYITQKRAFLPFVTANALGGYLALVFFLVLEKIGTVPTQSIFNHRDCPYFFYFLLFFISIALLLTRSLGALFSLFLGLILYLYLKNGDSPKNRDCPNPTNFLPLGLSLFFLFLVFLLRQAATKEHLLPLFSLSKRFAYWRQTLDIIRMHPFVGIGLGNFNLALTRYAHNSYLQLWAETGILGLASFFWLVCSVLKKIGTVPTQSIFNHRDCPYFFIAVIVFLLHNFVDFTFFLPEVSLIWWIILGLILCR